MMSWPPGQDELCGVMGSLSWWQGRESRLPLAPEEGGRGCGRRGHSSHVCLQGLRQGSQRGRSLDAQVLLWERARLS